MQNIHHYGLRVIADYTSVVFPVGRVEFSGEGVLAYGVLDLAGQGMLMISGEIAITVRGFGNVEIVTTRFTKGMISFFVKNDLHISVAHRGTIDDVVRMEHRVHLEDGASYTEIAAVAVNGMFDALTIVEHHGKSTSSVRSRIAVAEGAKAIVRGNIHMTAGALGSKGDERIDALLLGRKAEADVLPMLVVDTDDVTCKHGASVGYIDDNALFYLASRGLNPSEAKNMLVSAFLSVV